MSFLSRRLVFVALTMVFCTFQAIAQFSVNMPYKQVTVKEVDGVASFSGASIAGNVGQPALPVYKVTFLLPPDADLSTVSVTINNSSEQVLSNQYTVAPVQKIPGIELSANAVIIDGKDTGIYRKNAFFPNDYKKEIQTGALHQYKLVDITINPYRYNPVTKKLCVITGGTLKVSFNGGAKSLNTSRNPEAEKTLKVSVVNPELLDYYGTAPAATSSSTSTLKLQSVNSTAVATGAVATASLSGQSYLIVTTQNIRNNSQALTFYSNTLTNSGATVTIATESNWNPNGATNADQKADNLRAYIIDFYNSHINSNPLKYVLIIGNPNTVSGDIPMKKLNGTSTDYYYAELTDASSVDREPEVAVGRIPMYDTDWNKLDNYLYRVMFYQVATDVEWRRKILTASESYGFIPEGHEICENAIAALAPKGFSTKRLYHAYTLGRDDPFIILPGITNMNPLPDYTSFGTNHVADMWNSETPGIVFVAGHGEWYGTINVLQTDYFGSVPPNVQKLQNNGYPAMAFAASCLTIEPDYVNNCGVRTLFNTAIGFVGATDEVSSSKPLAIEFARLLGENYSIGDALKQAKISDFFNIYSENHCENFNLYGCPEVSLNLPAIGTVGAPANFRAQGSTTEQKITLSWNTVAGVNSWAIERSDDYSSTAKIYGFSYLGNCSGSSVSFTDRDVFPGTVYKYRIYASDVNGNRGPYSQIDSSTSFYRIPILSCGTPTNLTVTATHSNLVSLSWSGAANTTYYNVKRSTSTNGPFVTVTDVAGNNTTLTSLTDYNVTNDGTYYYTVSAVNQYGQSNNSNVVAATPTFDLSPPVITGISDQYDNNNTLQTTITWQSDYNNEVNFKFEWALRFPDGDYGITRSFGPIYRGATSFTWPNIGNNNTELGFRMRKFADDGTIATAYSDFLPFTSKPGLSRAVPSAPTGLTATLSQTTITLNWSYVLSSYPGLIPKNCEVYCKQNGGSWKLFTTANYPTNTATYTGASPKMDYQFCARTIFNDLTSGMNCYSRFSPVVSIPSDPCSGVRGGGSGLKGTTFGLYPPYAPGSEYCKATDGDINTYYDYSQADGGYTGFFLGYTAKVIEKIRFYPRAGNGSRMNGGKFQGSNTSSSSGFVDLYTISYTPSVQWNEVHISNSTAYRWVRYLSPTGGYCNIAELEFYLPPPQSPAYNGPHNIANGATLQVEDFDNGGEGVAYHDNDASNNGGQYRTNEGVDIENPTAGVTNVGWTNAGEWMDYTCNVTAGTYNITLYAASPNTGTQQVKLYQDNVLKATFTVPNTGGWQTYQAITVKGVSLAYNSASVLEIESTTGGYNLDKITIATSTTFPDPTKWYKIATRANTNLCLDVTGGNYANNTAIELWTKSSVNQEFQFKDAGNGYYTITCRNNTNYSIDMGGTFANSQTLKLWTTDVNNANQKFKPVPITGGYYRLETSNSSFSIDNWGAGGNGVKPALWTSDNNNVNQQWVITAVP